jgi:hypothetical protein
MHNYFILSTFAIKRNYSFIGSAYKGETVVRLSSRLVSYFQDQPQPAGRSPPCRICRMDDVWTRNIFSFYFCPVTNHSGKLCTNQATCIYLPNGRQVPASSCPVADHSGKLWTNNPHASTFLMATKCLTNLRTYMIITTDIHYLLTCCSY